MSAALAPLPESLAATRAALQQVAVHVVARRRHALTRRFGLRVTPGGFGMPAAGPEHEVVRVSGHWLLREVTGEGSRTRAADLTTASLADLAALGEVDLAAPFEVGRDTPPLADVDAPLGVDPAAAAVLATWYALGAALLDVVVATVGAEREPTVAQLWPEHFDLGLDIGVGGDRRANLGASPGDAGHPAPYLYVGPWGDERPGDLGFWNAAFGALLGYEDLAAAADPVAAGIAFFRRGCSLLDG